MVWSRNKLLGEVRTAGSGSLGCFLLPSVVVHEVKCLSDYRFTAKDSSPILLQVNVQIMSSPSSVCDNSFLA